jgi:polar amino acid transport system ATP-binding protein
MQCVSPSRVVFIHEGRIHEIGPPVKVFASPDTPERHHFLGVN